MAFEGNLTDFKVPDILQLVANQGKTGILTVASRDDTVTVGFEEGMVTAASYGKAGKQAPLQDYLLKSGRLSENELARVMNLRNESGLPLEDILIREKYVDEEELIELVRFKIQEVMDELFTWTEGRFRFEVDASFYKKSHISARVDVQSILLEGMRRMDEWPRIERALPSPYVIIGKKEQPILSIELLSEQKRILSLLDYDRTVEELIDLSGLGRFRTCHTLYNLLEIGAIEKRGEATPKRLVEEKEKKAPFHIPKYVSTIGLWAGFTLFFFVNFLVGFWLRPNWSWGRVPLNAPRELSDKDIEDLRRNLDLYYLGNGEYPSQLSALADLGLLPPHSISNVVYSATRDGRSYVLKRVKTD